MLRFSLATLFLITLGAAMVVAAIANPSYVWAQVLTTGTLLALIAITVGGICGKRTFLVGCAVAGWGYYFAAGLAIDVGFAADRLLTTSVSSFVFDAMHSKGLASPSFWKIAHLIWAWFFALTGGVFGVWCAKHPIISNTPLCDR